MSGTGLLDRSPVSKQEKGQKFLDEHGLRGSPTLRSVDHEVLARKELDDAIEDLGVQENRLRAKPADGAVMKNLAGDEVVRLGRPELGWGKCKHIDPEIRREVCVKEKWSDRSPFCREHLLFWRDRREGNRAKQVFEEEIAQHELLAEKGFFFKTAQDIMDFLSKLNYAVYRNWIPIGKARALSNIARVQIKALDSKIIAHRLHAIIAGLNKGGGSPLVSSPEELEDLEDDVERARMLGLDDVVKLVGQATSAQQERRIDFDADPRYPGHPKVDAPDPRTPSHPEDAAVDKARPGG